MLPIGHTRIFPCATHVNCLLLYHQKLKINFLTKVRATYGLTLLVRIFFFQSILFFKIAAFRMWLRENFYFGTLTKSYSDSHPSDWHKTKFLCLLLLAEICTSFVAVEILNGIWFFFVFALYLSVYLHLCVLLSVCLSLSIKFLIDNVVFIVVIIVIANLVKSHMCKCLNHYVLTQICYGVELCIFLLLFLKIILFRVK